MSALARDTGTIFARAMRMPLRNPAWLAISLLQPILCIVLFGPLLEPLSGQLGRVLRDVVVLLVQGTLLVLVSIPLGLRAPVVGVVLTLVVVALLGAAFASVSYALALTLTSEDAFAPLLNAFVPPVLLLSGILLPMTLAPGWLQAVSDVNPLKHVVSGARAFFEGDYGSGTAWWGAGLTVAMGVLGWWSGVRRFRQESS